MIEMSGPKDRGLEAGWIIKRMRLKARIETRGWGQEQRLAHEEERV